MTDTPKGNTASRKLKYKAEFTIGEKRALIAFIGETKVVDIPECIDIIQLKKALSKIKEC